MDLQRFYAGTCFDAYRYLGGHMEAEGGVFRTFAPSAAGEVPPAHLLHGLLLQLSLIHI